MSLDAVEGLLREAAALGSAEAFAHALDESFSRFHPAEAAASSYRFVWKTERADLLGSLSEVKALRVRESSCRTVALYHYRLGIGGADYVFLELANMFSAAGYDVVMLHDEPLPDGFVVDSAVTCELLPPFESSNPDNYLERALRLEEVLRHRGVEVLIYNQWLSHVLPWDMMVAKALGISFVVHVHGSFPTMVRWGAEHLPLLPIAYHAADAVVCLNDMNAEFWRAVNPRVFVTDNPIRFKCSSEEPASLRGHDVLWIARLDPAKHPEEALGVFREVVERVPDAKLHMVGGGSPDYLECLKEMADDLGIGESVVFHGAQNDPESFYKASSVLLMTSAEEGYPLVIGESKVFGLPVVMYDLPYLTFCEDPHGLLTVPQGDRSAAAHAIVALLQDEALRAACGKDARDDAERLQARDRLSYWKAVFEESLSKRADSGSEGANPGWSMRLLYWTELFKSTRKRAADFANLQAYAREQEKRVSELKSSTTMRVGGAVTAVPRALKDWATRSRKTD